MRLVRRRGFRCRATVSLQRRARRAAAAHSVSRLAARHARDGPRTRRFRRRESAGDERGRARRVRAPGSTLPDPEMLSWITGEAPVAARRSTRRCSRACAPAPRGVAEGRASRRERSPRPSRRLASRRRRHARRAPEGYDAFVVADLARALAREAESARGRAGLRRPRRRCARRAFIDALAFAAPEIEALLFARLGLPALRPRLAQRRRSPPQRMTALARLARDARRAGAAAHAASPPSTR